MDQWSDTMPYVWLPYGPESVVKLSGRAMWPLFINKCLVSWPFGVLCEIT